MSYVLSKEQRTNAARALAASKKRLSAKLRKECGKLVKLSRRRVTGVWMLNGMQESGITQIMLVRETGEDAYAYAIAVVDVLGMGAKDAFARTNVTEDQYLDRIDSIQEQLMSEFVPVDPGYAVALLHETVTLRLAIGLTMHPDLHLALAFAQGIAWQAHQSSIELGSNGKLQFIQGPFDDMDEIHAVVSRLDAETYDLIEVEETF